MPASPGPGPAGPAAPAPGPKGPSSQGLGGPRAPAPGPGPAAKPKLPTLPITGLAARGDQTGWRTWWDHNRDSYLELRPTVRLRERPSDDGNFYLGQGSGREALDLTVRQDQLLEEVLPALVTALRDNGSAEMRRRALLAFAKLPSEQCAEAKVDRHTIFETYLADQDLAVTKTAVVCLGLLGGSEAIDTLEHMLMACDVGAKLIERNHVPLDVRVTAAYALGLAGSRTTNLDERRFVLHFLNQAIDHDSSASPDLASACVAAIGVVPMPAKGSELSVAKVEPLTESREAQLAMLLGFIGDDDQRRISRAHAVTAVGRLMAAEGGAQLADRELVARKLIRLLSSSAGEAREVRQSAALALGMMADSDGDKVDVTIRKALMRSTADTDHLTRYFAMVSLAQAAGRAGDAERDVLMGSEEARDHLVKILVRGKSQSRPWAALSLGVLGHGIKDGGWYPSEDTSRALGELLRTTCNPETVGALATALGLRGDGQYRALLEERLADFEGDDRTRSEIGVAMGMLGASGSEGALRELFDGASNRPTLLREAAIARALLGDDRVSQDLIAELAGAETLASQIGVSGALAFVGESRTVAPITAAFERDSTTKTGRSFLVGALGEICEGTALPWTSTYSEGVNYGAATESLEQGYQEGLLNLD